MAKRLPPRLEAADNGQFYVIYSANGRSQRKSLRTDNLFVAEARFSGWLEQHQKDSLVDADPKIEDCLAWWMSQWIEGRMLSEKRYPSVVNNLNAYFAKKRVSEITREHSLDYARQRREGRIGRCSAAEGTIRHELQKLRACLRFMTEAIEPRERRISRDLLPFIELPQPSPPRNRVLSQGEVERLRDFCSNLVWNGQGRTATNRLSKVGRFILIAMETAQRKSAILNLQWQQVDLDKGMIHFLPAGKLQTIKRRPALPISSRLRPVLERSFDERVNSFVCDNNNDVHEAIKRVGKELDIDGLSPHVFRHTWATRAVESGASLEKVAAFLGDSIDTVRENYMHLSPDYLRDVVDQL